MPSTTTRRAMSSCIEAALLTGAARDDSLLYRPEPQIHGPGAPVPMMPPVGTHRPVGQTYATYIKSTYVSAPSPAGDLPAPGPRTSPAPAGTGAAPLGA